MTQPLSELVEQFCHFQCKQRGKSERGVTTYRWVLEQFLVFLKTQKGRDPAAELREDRLGIP